MTHSINGEKVHVEMSVKEFKLMCAFIEIGQAAIEVEKSGNAVQSENGHAEFWRCKATLVRLVKEYNQLESETGGAL